MTGSQTCPTVPSPSKLGYRRLMVRSVLSSGIVITGTTSHPLFARTVWPTMRRPCLQFSPVWLSRHPAWRWISVRTPESLSCSPRQPTRNCGSARLSRWKAYENCCTKPGAQSRSRPAHRRRAVRFVACRRQLYGWAKALGPGAIELVKIDVEGHEDAVIEGGRKTIDRHRPFILLKSSALAEWKRSTRC